MTSAVASTGEIGGQVASFHLWWKRLERCREPGDILSSVRARRERRRAWIRDRLGTVTDDVEAVIAAVGQVSRPGVDAWASWSSCGDIVVLAFGRRPVAVDVEVVRAVPPGMANRFGIAADRFWPGWTRKEAGLKLLSTGLRVDPVRLALLDDGTVALDGTTLPIRMEAIAAPPFHVAALAYFANDGMDDAGGR